MALPVLSFFLCRNEPVSNQEALTDPVAHFRITRKVTRCCHSSRIILKARMTEVDR